MTFGGPLPHRRHRGGAPPGAELSPAQRLRAVAVAVAARRELLGPLRRSAAGRGFAARAGAAVRRAAGGWIEPEEVEASAATLEGSAYLSDLAALFAGYEEVRRRSGRADAHGIAREAIAQLRRDGASGAAARSSSTASTTSPRTSSSWWRRWPSGAEVTVALPYEEGNAALAARGRLLRRLRERIGAAEEVRPRPTRPTPRARPLPPRPAPSAPPAQRSSPTEPHPAALGRDPGRGRGDRRRSRGWSATAPTRPRSRSPCAIPPAAAPRSRRRWRRTASPPRWRPRCRSAGTSVAAPCWLCWRPSSVRAGRPTCCATCAGRRASPTRPGRLVRAAGCGAAGCGTPRRRWPSGRARRASRPATWCGCARPPRARRPSWPRRSGRWRRDGRAAAARRRTTGRGWANTTGLELRAAAAIAGALGRARRAWAAGARGPGAGRRHRRARASASGRGRSRAGCGSPAPTACAPPASTTSSSARCRTASSPPRPRRRPLPLRRAARDARPRAAPRPRSRGALPVPRLPGAAPPQPLPLLPRQRRGRRRGGALAAARRGAGAAPPAPDGTAPDPVEEGMTRRRDLARVVAPVGRSALGGRAGASAGGDFGRPRGRGGRSRTTELALLAQAGVEGEICGPRLSERLAAARPRRGGRPRARAADQPGGARVARRRPRLRRNDPGGVRRCSYRWFAGHELVRSRSNRRPTRSSRAG